MAWHLVQRQVGLTRTGGLWRSLGLDWCWVGSGSDVVGSTSDSGSDSEEDKEEDSEEEEGFLIPDVEGRVTILYGPFKMP